MWDAETGEAIGNRMEHSNDVKLVAFSPQGDRIVSACVDGTIQVWDVETQEAIWRPLEGHLEEVNGIQFSPNGDYIISCSNDMTIRLWDVKTEDPVAEPLERHVGTVDYVSFSPHGDRIVSCSDDYTLRFWDARTGDAVGKPLNPPFDPYANSRNYLLASYAIPYMLASPAMLEPHICSKLKLPKRN